MNPGEAQPFALTDAHVAALERAIVAEGYRINVDPETGEVKLISYCKVCCHDEPCQCEMPF